MLSLHVSLFFFFLSFPPPLHSHCDFQTFQNVKHYMKEEGRLPDVPIPYLCSDFPAIQSPPPRLPLPNQESLKVCSCHSIFSIPAKGLCGATYLTIQGGEGMKKKNNGQSPTAPFVRTAAWWLVRPVLAVSSCPQSQSPRDLALDLYSTGT